MATSATMGTLAYMAPEQIQGKPRPQSDQYALAVTVYQWLTGKLPFVGSSAEIIAQHLGAPPPPLRTSVPDLPQDVEQVVLTALAKDPQQRFGSVQGFAKALALASSLPPESSPLSLVPPAQSPQSGADTATQQAHPAPVASGSKLSTAPRAQLALTPPVLSWSEASSLTPSGKPPRSRPASEPGFPIKGTLIGGLVLLLVIGSVFWFTRPGQGDGTEASPYRLSSGDSSMQHIGITLQQTKGSREITVTVNSLQILEKETDIDISLKGLDASQQYRLSTTLDMTPSSYSYNPQQQDIAPNTAIAEEVVKYLPITLSSLTPQAGQEWTLQIALYTENLPENDYQTLYLQF
jgi:serine/threonine protein kinase